MGLIGDFDYIEGAITIKYYENNILSFKQWDIVDQLWSYFINAIEELVEGKKRVCFNFPDQPIEVIMSLISEEQILLSIGGDKTSFNKKELLIALLTSAEKFFHILKECTDEYLMEHSNNELKRIYQMLNRLNIQS